MSILERICYSVISGLIVVGVIFAILGIIGYQSLANDITPIFVILGLIIAGLVFYSISKSTKEEAMIRRKAGSRQTVPDFYYPKSAESESKKAYNNFSNFENRCRFDKVDNDEECRKGEYDNGYDDGYVEGYYDGRVEGYDIGSDRGNSDRTSFTSHGSSKQKDPIDRFNDVVWGKTPKRGKR
ncbi:MAG: hypothetical protein ABFC24_03975 [Methanoregulaceae archaeon]